MTREEAINVLNMVEAHGSIVIEAKKMAIEALKQEPFINKQCVSSGVCEHDKRKVLDEIRAEIDQKQYDFMADGDYNEGIRFGLMLAYQIINKHLEESEDKE